MPTGTRGEAVFTVEEETYTVLLTNRALAHAERLCGKALATMLTQPGMREHVALLVAGLEASRHDTRAGGRAYTENDAWKILDAVGFARVTKALMRALNDALGDASEEEDGDESGRPTTTS